MTQDIRICFVGDSLVNGTGDKTALGWAGRLCAKTNDYCNVTYYNLGVRRDTSRDILLRWQGECAARLPASCDGRIVFSFGINDTVLENGEQRIAFEESLANIHNVLLQSKRYPILVVGPTPVEDDSHNARIQILSEGFFQQAKMLGIAYIDLFSVLSSDLSYKQELAHQDGAHPTHVGYGKIASIIQASPLWWFYHK